MLTPNDQAVKKADNKALRLAKRDDERHRLHAEPATHPDSASPYWKRWVEEFITPTIPSVSKRLQLLRQFSWPLVSVEVVDDIMDAAAAVHYAQDRFIAVQMNDDKLQADAEAFLDRRDVAGFIARSCHNALFSAPNSLVVVDAPAEQTTDFPEPYCYLVPIDKVKAAEAHKGPADAGLLKFAFFETDQPKRYALFDEVDFAIYERNLTTGGEWEEISREPHNLPFTPAFKMWADVDDRNPMVSNTVLRPLLGLLDRYVFWDGGRETNDLAAAFQIFWHLETESCEYKTADGFKCQKGIIERPVVDLSGHIVPNQRPNREACPLRDVCSSRSLGGPGSKLPIPAQQSKDDADYRLPAGWIAADIDNLKYIEEKVEKLRAKIVRTATGYEGGPQNKQALNEDQILSILERARQVGQYLAEHFEMLHARVIEALCRLRYGSAYVGCTVNYGRRFALLSGDQLMVLYDQAKTIGSQWLMEEIDSLIMDYYARTDASRRLRFHMLKHLNPYPNMTTDELVSAGIDQIDPEGFTLSVGLLGFVNRFEREHNTTIEQLGTTSSFGNRISLILESLKSYVKDLKPVQPATGAGEGPTDPPTGGNRNRRNRERKRTAGTETE